MRGGKIFEAGGKEYRLHFSTNALCRLEDAAGIGVMELAARLNGGAVKMADLRLMMWAGLPEGTTLAEAGDLMDCLGIDRAADLIGAAFEASFPAGDGDEKKTGATAA